MKHVALSLFISIISTPLFAQSNTISLEPLNDTEIVSLETSQAIISFRKADIIRVFDDQMKYMFFADKPESEKSANSKIIDRLRREKKAIRVQGNSKKSEDLELIRLLHDQLGATLLNDGQAEVYDKVSKTNQKQIQVVLGESATADVPNDFFFIPQNTKFFSGKSFEFMETTSVEETEAISVVFEEPIQEIRMIEEDEDKIFTVIEQQAEYPGGMTKLVEFISKELRYPKEAKEKKLVGNVFVEFVIEKDGTLTDVKVIKGLSVECDKEAIRVIQKSSPWKPGKQNGKVVKQRYVLPVKYKLD